MITSAPSSSFAIIPGETVLPLTRKSSLGYTFVRLRLYRALFLLAVLGLLSVAFAPSSRSETSRPKMCAGLSAADCKGEIAKLSDADIDYVKSRLVGRYTIGQAVGHRSLRCTPRAQAALMKKSLCRLV